MIKKISKSISHEMYRQDFITEKQIDVCTYLFEFILDYLIFIIYIILISAITKNFHIALYYIGILVLGRKLCGGGHFKSKMTCTIFSYLSFFSLIFLCDKESTCNFDIPIYSLTICCIILWRICPVYHPNKHFSPTEIIKLRRKCRIFLIILLLFMYLLHMLASRQLIYAGNCVYILTISCIMGKICYKSRQFCTQI